MKVVFFQVYKPGKVRALNLIFLGLRLTAGGVLLHFLTYSFSHTFLTHPHLVRRTHSVVALGSWYTDGLALYLTYLHIWGWQNLVGRLDGFEMLALPGCVPKVFNFTELWR